jgi:hypothetical protein
MGIDGKYRFTERHEQEARNCLSTDSIETAQEGRCLLNTHVSKEREIKVTLDVMDLTKDRLDACSLVLSKARGTDRLGYRALRGSVRLLPRGQYLAERLERPTTVRVARLLGKDGENQIIEWIAQNPARRPYAITAFQGRVNPGYQIY